MSNQACVYDLPGCTDQLTREHIISRAALKVAFGDEIRNVVTGHRLGSKQLIDNEPVTRSVCSRCNSALSPYDVAGAEMVREIQPFFDPTARSITFTENTLRWILKTHFNHFDVSRDQETEERYTLPRDIRRALIEGSSLEHAHVALFVDVLEGDETFWDAESSERIQFFHYSSIRFRSQEIVLSHLQVKMINFMLLVPYRRGYRAFAERCASVMREVRRDFGTTPRRVATAREITSGLLRLEPVIPNDVARSWRRPTPRS